MELPKNIVQIGSPDRRYKIFVEDYVISYIKEVNRSLCGGQAGIAFYGKKYAEGEINYYFIYGAAEIGGLEGRGQYLSEKERDQIEAKKLEFFEELEFLSWCTVSGDMPEGFYLPVQGKGVWVNGYATFFEKNENMLNFMLIMGKREKKRALQEDDFGRLAEGGNIDHRIMERSRKLSELRKTGEYRKNVSTDRRIDKYERNGSWKTVMAGIVVMLCVIGIAALSDENKMNEFQVVTRQIMASFGEQKLPDAEISLEEKATEVLEMETLPPITIETASEEMAQQETTEPVESVTESSETDNPVPVESEPEESETDVPEFPETGTTETGNQDDAPASGEDVVSDEVETDKTVTYIVQKGDALLTICKNHYGSDARLQEVCEINQIDNPDDIKVGQTILLPE